MSRRSLLVSLCVLFIASKAYASTDISGLFDARSTAMGGTGAAFLDSAGAIPINPALLDQIPKLALTLDCFFIQSTPEAPYTIAHIDSSGRRYLTYETIRSEAASAPLPFAGGAYRIHERVVIGAAVYPVIGQDTSAKYKPAPDEYPNVTAANDAAMGLIEGAVPITFRILDNLSVSAMWRVTYMTQSVSTPVPNNGKPPAEVLILPNEGRAVNADLSVSGVNLLGFQLGALYKPVPWLRIGLTYRSKVKVDGTGTTTTKIGAMPTILDTKSSYTNPHSFRLGLAATALNDRLLVATDLKYLLYAEAFEYLDVTTRMGNGPEKTEHRPLMWKNSFSAHFGIEYKLIEALRARLGYNLVTSATPPDYALAQAAPPGVSHCWGGGVGIAVLDSLNVDLAGAYVVLQSRVNTPTEHNAGVGIYASHGIELAASVTYHL